eukprot:CAMPEP_0116832054 /NCGR_PEP_ID=MMETSP0418-20121206/5680_1 /TAXON_ID=1158023 /ORGANISM="Astrosyne radiata, Strain 13vi08-1A" /LENGTH=479 /DNA_ID=CAMNT_0004461375 /DNA_START=574 /DNA_END=2013 /DNA_ORIENTATION=-
MSSRKSSKGHRYHHHHRRSPDSPPSSSSSRGRHGRATVSEYDYYYPEENHHNDGFYSRVQDPPGNHFSRRDIGSTWRADDLDDAWHPKGGYARFEDPEEYSGAWRTHAQGGHDFWTTQGEELPFATRKATTTSRVKRSASARTATSLHSGLSAHAKYGPSTQAVIKRSSSSVRTLDPGFGDGSNNDGQLQSGLSARRAVANFFPGDHIKVDKGYFDHHAIFLEWITPSDGMALVMQHTNKMTRSGQIRACQEDVREYILVTRPRHPKVVLARAYEKEGSGEYHLLEENCEHFCHYCISGVSMSTQIMRHEARSEGILTGKRKVTTQLVATEFCQEIVQSIESYMREEITGAACAKQIASAAVSVGGGLAGAAVGYAVADAFFPEARLMAALVGGALGQHVCGALFDKLVHEELLQESREAAIEAAYQTLGVSPDATDQEVNKAYRRLAREHHPDRGGEQGDFVTVSMAMEIIRAARSIQ